jgi:hypothetical protein
VFAKVATKDDLSFDDTAILVSATVCVPFECDTEAFAFDLFGGGGNHIAFDHIAWLVCVLSIFYFKRQT